MGLGLPAALLLLLEYRRGVLIGAPASALTVLCQLYDVVSMQWCARIVLPVFWKFRGDDLTMSPLTFQSIILLLMK